MDDSFSIYDKLLQLPLFQGHSREDLTAILTKIKVDFRSFRTGQTIIQQDSPCQSLIFLMEGDICSTRTSIHKDIVFSECFSAPNAFGAETIFGLRQNFSHTITAKSEVKVLMLSKQNIVNHMFAYDVFRYNMLNLLSTRIQRTNQLLWQSDDKDITSRFVKLCKNNFTYHAGKKEILGGMVSLAKMMNETRNNVSDMLNELQTRKLVSLARRRISIPHLEKLIQSI